MSKADRTPLRPIEGNGDPLAWPRYARRRGEATVRQLTQADSLDWLDASGLALSALNILVAEVHWQELCIGDVWVLCADDQLLAIPGMGPTRLNALRGCVRSALAHLGPDLVLKPTASGWGLDTMASWKKTEYNQHKYKIENGLAVLIDEPTNGVR